MINECDICNQRKLERRDSRPMEITTEPLIVKEKYVLDFYFIIIIIITVVTLCDEGDNFSGNSTRVRGNIFKIL